MPWSDDLRQIYKKLIAIDVKLDLMLAKAQQASLGNKKVSDVRQETVGGTDTTAGSEAGKAQTSQRQSQ